jgi:hypothetical protein
MGKSVKKPKKHIISCRVDDGEIVALKRLARASNTNISNLLRRSLDMLEEASAGKRQARV